VWGSSLSTTRRIPKRNWASLNVINNPSGRRLAFSYEMT
jgi:hypothetical protein